MESPDTMPVHDGRIGPGRMHLSEAAAEGEQGGGDFKKTR